MYFTVETHPSYMRGERVAFKHTTCMPAPPPSRQREGRRRDVIQQWKLMRAPSCGKIWQYSKPVSFIQEGRGGSTQQAGRPLAWLNTIRISFFFLMNLNYLTKYSIEHHNWNSQKGRLSTTSYLFVLATVYTGSLGWPGRIVKVSLCLNCFLFKNFLHNFNASISQQMARRAGKGDGGRGGRFAAMAVIGGRGDLGKYVGKGK